MKPVKMPAGKPGILKSKSEDSPEPQSPVVFPSCRLPRESPKEVSPTSAQKSSPPLVLARPPSTLKSKEEKETVNIVKNEKKLQSETETSVGNIVHRSGVVIDVVVTDVKSGEKKDKLDTSSPEDVVSMVETPPVVPTKSKRIPIVDPSSINYYNPTNVAVPRRGALRPAPGNLDERPLILATHLVPSLPIDLFEIIAEVIEAATGKAVCLLYESRVDRPVPKDLVDIAILPASEDWKDGSLLPVSFIFDHAVNKDKTPSVYVDIVVSTDCIQNIEGILDLRGYRCALPDRRKALGAAGLLFNHLKSKGENPSFFGNTLDSGSQLAALQMVAGKQAEIGVLEAPVINCHKNILPGADSLYRLGSLGPLPPYRIMLNKNIEASALIKIKEHLLNVERDESWMDRLKQYGVLGFGEYNEDRYDLEDFKSVVTSVPYY